MKMDELLFKVAEDVKNFCVIYVVKTRLSVEADLYRFLWKCTLKYRTVPLEVSRTRSYS